jgi:hypothetical protein
LGEWPRNWIEQYRATTNDTESAGPPPQDFATNFSSVPAAAKNISANLYKTFGKATWKTLQFDHQYKAMTFRINAVKESQYVRLRGTNLPASVPYETDANGNPLPDLWTNPAAVNPTVPSGNDGQPANANLRIPCTTGGTTEFDGCPNHLPVKDGVKYVAYDVAAWSDLWFYSNPIYIEVRGSTQVAGVN